MLTVSRPKRIAVKVKKAAERMIRKQHPWVFDHSIVKQNKAGKAGDLAMIYDQQRNKLLAIGLYDPDSPIRIKLLHFKESASIDESWFQRKIATAYEKRRPLFETDTNSYRLIHGENDGLPALVADVYADVLVLKLYAAIWLPYLEALLPILNIVSQTNCIVLRLSRNLQSSSPSWQDGQVLYGNLAKENVQFKEHGLLFSANVIKGHKTGYFLDHRHNRKKIRMWAKGKSVLDVFAYAGGFSVHALAGGAKQVISLDVSAQALAMAKQNVQLNHLEAKHETLAIDAFEGMENLARENRKFNMVIVDPPAFAKRATEIDRALKSYARLTRLAVPLVAPNGILLMASCSSRVSATAFFESVLKQLQLTGRPFQELQRTFHDVDHPIGFPEGAYLKSIYFRLSQGGKAAILAGEKEKLSA
ncbi:MAG: class I SAM-dependent rRNA methyltransferase [Bacteroidota bacterium]